MFTNPAIKQHLAKNLLWDEEYQTLWLDLRKLSDRKGVLAIPSWDKMMLASDAIPSYPINLDLLNWTPYSDLRFWLDKIPSWILESCQLFDTYQLHLLHYVARYPQLLEILEHAPFLAWQLVSSPTSEADKVKVLQTSWVNILQELGLASRSESVKFIRSLRLRQIDENRIEQIHACLADDIRLDKLQSLPRVNSFALALAAYFPDLIAHKLHHSLASIPCRPNQCQAMVHQLQDFYSLANYLGRDATNLIGSYRYLVEVEDLYLSWWDELNLSQVDLKLTDKPQKLTSIEEWQSLSKDQVHPWWLNEKLIQAEAELWAWHQDNKILGILVETTPDSRIIKSRVGQNKLLNPKQQVAVEVALNTYILN